MCGRPIHIVVCGQRNEWSTFYVPPCICHYLTLCWSDQDLHERALRFWRRSECEKVTSVTDSVTTRYLFWLTDANVTKLPPSTWLWFTTSTILASSFGLPPFGHIATVIHCVNLTPHQMTLTALLRRHRMSRSRSLLMNAGLKLLLRFFRLQLF